MVNLELLNNTLELINNNLDHWDQGAWHKGDKHSFAGFVELQHMGLSPQCNEDDICDRKDDYKTFDVAQKALGISDDTAKTLFDFNNTLGVIKAIIIQLNKTPFAHIYHVYSCFDTVTVCYINNNKAGYSKRYVWEINQWSI